MTNELMKKCLTLHSYDEQRQITIGVIENSEDHPDVDQLYRRTLKEYTTIFIATLYLTVQLLEEAGVFDRLELFGRKNRWIWPVMRLF